MTQESENLEPKDPNFDLVFSAFDETYYQIQISQDLSKEECVAHFLENGWKDNKNPSLGFDCSAYMERNLDIKWRDENPYAHYLQFGRYEGRSPSKQKIDTQKAIRDANVEPQTYNIINDNFDKELYCKSASISENSDVDPVLHYISFGWKSNLNPNAYFDTSYYMTKNADVKSSGVNPFFHYVTWGKKEGRRPSADYDPTDRLPPESSVALKQIEPFFDEEFYAKYFDAGISPTVNPLLHYFHFGWRMGLNPCEYFDTKFYIKHYPEVNLGDGICPLYHFVSKSFSNGAIPFPCHYLFSLEGPQREVPHEQILSKRFDEDFYGAISPDLNVSNVNFLTHYRISGWKEDRRPFAEFDIANYKIRFPDFARYDIDPLTHHILYEKAQALFFKDTPHDFRNQSGLIPKLTFTDPSAPRVDGPAPSSQIERRLNLHWIIPEFGIGGGGHMTIFRTIHWLEFYGHKCTIWVKGTDRSASTLYDEILKYYQFVKADIKIWTEELLQTQADAIIATSWDTVYSADQCQGFRQKFYFVQDYEALFHARGSQAILAEETYKKDFVCITAGKWLQTKMQEHSRTAYSFDLAFDSQVYYPATTKKASSQLFRIALYGRIETERRCVELALMGLAKLAEKRDDFIVDIFGNSTPMENLGFECVDHGIVDSATLGDIYRNSDLGISFSGTNYSLVPQEMMACGLPVLELDVENARAAIPGEAALFTKPSPTEIATFVSRIMDDPAERERVVGAALDWVGTLSWENSTRQVEKALLEEVALTLDESDRATLAPLETPSFSSKATPKASVLIPTYNGGQELPEVFAALKRQYVDFPYEVIIVDSGSKDDTRAVCEEFGVAKFVEIDKSEFQHGRTRNFAASHASGEYLLFLTQDAIPSDRFWLYNFVSAMDVYPEAAGGFGRHIARNDATGFTQHEIRQHFLNFNDLDLCLSKYSDLPAWNRNDGGFIRRLHFFSDNNSCLRRSCWEQLPYPEVNYGEDQLWALEAAKLGWSRLYCPQATVIHSHDFDFEGTLERSQIEAQFFRDYFGYDLSTKDIQRSTREGIADATRFAAKHRFSQEDLELRKQQIAGRILGWNIGHQLSLQAAQEGV